MSAVDPVAAYEAGVRDCHGAPQRDCCVRAGLDAVWLAVRPAPTPTPTPDPVRASPITTAGARIITAALAWRDTIPWTDDRDLALTAAVDAYRAAPEAEGWGAMLRHGQAESPSRTAQLVQQERMGFAVDWSLERRTARCLCVETTTGAEYDRGQRTWLPGCDQHPAPAARRHCTCSQEDITEFGNTSAKPLPVRGITDPECPAHGRPADNQET